MDNFFSRRDFLNKLLLIGYATSAGSFISACSPFINNRGLPSPEMIPDVEVSLTAKKDAISIFPGTATSVWRYSGEVLKGSENTIQEIHDSYLGPILHFKKGQNVRIHFKNNLDESSIIHWHGLHVPESADGHPQLAIDPGEEYVYDFKVMDRAGMYWYHPHPHGRTGPQVFYGLAGLILITDDEESSLDLPQGNYDLPIVIQDRTFSADNQFVYEISHMGQMVGFLGEQLLINGKPDNLFNVEQRPYRLRILNGSNARTYKLAWSDASLFTIIGTDGGLLDKPIERSLITLAPAQRIDLWVDFSKFDLGTNIELVNSPNSTPGGSNPFTLMSFNIDQPANSTQQLPGILSQLDLHDPMEAINRQSPREFSLQMGMGMAWNINGRTFEMKNIANDEIVKLDDLEIWQFSNTGENGAGMILPHPMHIHGLQFQVIEREVTERMRESWQTVSDGFVDEGWHDTVLVMPGEKVKVLLKFSDYEGTYLYHCHNLEHEDMGMMRNYSVSL